MPARATTRGRTQTLRPTHRPGPAPRRCGDHGQATVELALAMPLVALFLLAMVQVALVVRDQVAVIHAAREGARAAAVSSAPGSSASAAARDAISLDPLSVTTTSSGSRITTSVRYVSRTDVPIVGVFIPDVSLQASATMRFEPS